MNLIKLVFPIALLLLLMASCDKDNCPEVPVRPTMPSTFLINDLDFNGDTLRFNTMTITFRPDTIPSTGDFLWELGDGTVSDETTITHTFQRKGVYSNKMTYTVSDDCGTNVGEYTEYIIEIQ